MAKNPHDASKRVVQFTLDEHDAVRLEKYCAMNRISRQSFLSRITLERVSDVRLTNDEILKANRAIEARIAKGYNVPFSGRER